MSDLTQFHILSHTIISAIGGILLLAIWYTIRQQFRQILEEDDSKKRVDKGLLYLSLAMFTWVGAGIWRYLGHADTETIVYALGVSLLSILNNCFFLLALFYFYHGPTFIYQNQKNVSKILAIIIGTAVVTLLIPFFLQEQNIVQGIRISSIPDLLLSGFLSVLLMISFYRTFMAGSMKVVAWIAVTVILLMFVSQLPEVFLIPNQEFATNLLKITSKTSLIAIFLVLATTWVIRLASMPKPNEMALQFLDWSLVKISIPSKEVFEQTIDFGSKTTQYRNLLKFAIRRKYGDQPSQSITVGAAGEIKNQTYLSRIIDNINTILQLDEQKQLERRDLFTFIGHSKYRIRMIPDNIQIDEALLTEFTEQIDNQKYKTIVTDCNSSHNSTQTAIL